MKYKPTWAGALALTLALTSQLEVWAATNGIILITTRKDQDLSWGLADSGNIKGPGQTSPGDVGMETILMDHGYSCRFILDAELNETKSNPYLGLPGDPYPYLFPTADTNYNVMLVINSGTSGSGDIGAPNTNGIPIMMSEHSCIATGVRVAHNSIYLYAAPPTATTTDDVKDSEPAQGGTNQYMKVLLPNHPIMQGIPLDAEGRVKIFRDPYPGEGTYTSAGAYMPVGGKPNYEYAWTCVDANLAAPGTQVIGVLAGITSRACFATADIGAELGDYTTGDPEHPWSLTFGDNKAHQRLVHWLINDQGSGGSRRCFNALTDIGRVIFIRTCKWAMGETLAPYQALGVIQASVLNPTQIQLAWTGTATKNYKILGTRNLFGPADFFNWQTVAQDIKGLDGTVTAKLNIANGGQYAFLRVMPVP